MSDNPQEILPGDWLVCTRPPGKDRFGRPAQAPLLDHRYQVAQVYRMKYGWGVKLFGLDPAPYRGYLLLVTGTTFAQHGWYFRKLVRDDAPAEPWFTKELMKHVSKA